MPCMHGARALVILSTQERPGFPHVKRSRSYFNIRPPGGGVYLETRPIHIHQLRGSFLCSQFKMQSEIDCGSSRGRIFSKLDNVFHVSCCARIAFLKKLFISHTISLSALCVTNTNQPVEKERFDITEPRQRDLAVFVTLMDDAEKVVNVCSEGKQMNKVQNRDDDQKST